MIDSGASSNFLGVELLEKLGVTYTSYNKYSVRLADGSVLSTRGQVVLHVDFGACKYSGIF
jgi:hypothetical protein